jgi:transcriptional regulator with XRE-family HTH domain
MSREKFAKEKSAFRKAVGRRIIEARNHNTAVWLANSLKVAPARISEWESGKKLIRVDTLLRIAQITGRDLYWLASGEHTIPPRVMESPSYDVPPTDVNPDAWPAIRAILPRLSLIYEAQAILTHAKQWELIKGTVETFSDMLRHDVEALRKAKEKSRGAG